MTLPNDVVGCDFCENTSATPGRIIYECDECGADCCDLCSDGPFEPFGVVYCQPNAASGREGCAPEDWE